jgi:parallel beta-helix repeat protein
VLGWADVRAHDGSSHRFNRPECHAEYSPAQLCEQNGSVLDAGGGSIQDCRISANKLNGVLVGDGADPALSGNNIQQNGASGMSLKVQSTLLPRIC